MKGSVKIQVIDDNDEAIGLAVSTELKDVSKADKVLLLDAFMRGVDMSDDDVILALALRATKLESVAIRL